VAVALCCVTLAATTPSAQHFSTSAHSGCRKAEKSPVISDVLPARHILP
jgi:hypothetical protein